MAVRVSLRQVVDELEALPEDSTAYLNRETGELYTLGDEAARLVEDGVDADDLLEWLSDEVPKTREILESDDWLCLPTRFGIHEWAIMDEFAREADDADVGCELLNAIRGTGAFRAFKDAIYRRGLQESWYRYRASAIARVATDWLDEQGIAYVRHEDVTSAE